MKKSPSKPLDEIPDMTYAEQYVAGQAAKSEDECPYPITWIGERCAWLAGFRDKNWNRKK